VVVCDVYGGRRVLQWLSVSMAGCIVIEKNALSSSVSFVAIVVVVDKV
jgi:hypothetical protein